MKKRVLYISLVIIFVIALIITMTVGLKVNLEYTKGCTVTFSVGKEIKLEDIELIASDIFGKNNFLVQQVEMFNDSALIKTTEPITDEQLQVLCNKLNEKYGVELTTDTFEIKYHSNIRLRDIIEPYMVPVGLSTLLILAYYAVRYKHAKKMIELLKYLVISEGILYSLYAIGRIQVNGITIPIALILYSIVIVIYTTISELELNSKKEA